MKRLTLLGMLSLAGTGCTINAITPIQATTQVQANTQVDQRSGSFEAGSGPTQTIVGGPPAVQTNPGPASQPDSGTGPQGGATPEPLKKDSWVDKVLFTGIRKFQTPFKVSAVSFNEVRVLSNGVLHITDDAGRSWTTLELDGSKSASSMYWLDKDTGWVGADAGTLLRLNRKPGGISVEPIDCQTGQAINSVCFLDERHGFIISKLGTVKETQDGGTTWTISMTDANFMSDLVRYRDQVYISFNRDGYDIDHSYNRYDPMYRYNAGGFETRLVEGASSMWFPSFGPERTYFYGWFEKGGPQWAWTDNFKTSTPLGQSLKTPTGFVRDRVQRVYALSANQLMAQLTEGRYLFSEDGGTKWSAVKNLGPSFTSIIPFGDSKIWASARDTLYRSGI